MSSKLNQSAMDALMNGLTSTSESVGASSAQAEENKPVSTPITEETSQKQSKAEKYRTKSGGIRVSVIVKETSMEKVKYIMEKENFSQSQIFDAAITMLINKYEEKKGPIKPRQNQKKEDISELFDL